MDDKKCKKKNAFDEGQVLLVLQGRVWSKLGQPPFQAYLC